MKRIYTLVFLPLLGLVAPLHAKTESGTVIVIAQSQAKVTIAADSRTISDTWQVNDDVDKISFLRPNFIFAATGIIADNSFTLAPDSRFAALDVAKQVVRDFKPDKEDTHLTETGQIANIWSLTMSFKMRKGLDKRLDAWLLTRKPQLMTKFLCGIFIGEEPDKSLSVVIAILDYDPPRPGWITPLVRPYLLMPGLSNEFTWIEAWGKTDVVDSYLNGHRDISDQITAQMHHVEDFDFKVPFTLVLRTIAEAQPIAPGKPAIVGGKIDVAELKAGSDARWLCRKSQCSSESSPSNK